MKKILTILLSLTLFVPGLLTSVSAAEGALSLLVHKLPKKMSREQVGAAILDRSEVRGADEGDKVYTHFAIVVDGKVTKTWTSPQALDCFPTRYKEAFPSGDTFFPSGDTFFPGGDTFFPGGDTFFPSGDTFDVVARRVAPKAWKIASPRRGGFVVLTGVSHASEAKHPSAITAVPLRR